VNPRCPKNKLGISTGLCRITGKEIFCVVKVFYDGSEGEDEAGDKWITFAAVAGTDAVWAEFDKRWSKMLASRYPIAPYIHMIEILDDEDPFEPLVGWDFSKKHSLIQDAIVLLSQMDKAGFVMAWSSINESARLRAQKEGVRVPESASIHCAADCVFFTVGVYMLNIPDEKQEPIYVSFDRGEKFLGKFKQNYLKHRTIPGRPKNPENWFDSFADVRDVDLPNHFGLQAADMVAWAHSRTLSDKDRPFAWLKNWLLEVVPSIRAEYGEKLLRNLKKDPALRIPWEKLFR
jgi:hypothetical protein